MHPKSQLQTRQNFVKWGLGVVASLTLFKIAGLLGYTKKSSEVKTIKMLGQDGKLVEVIQNTLPANRKKISDNELKNWIKKN